MDLIDDLQPPTDKSQFPCDSGWSQAPRRQQGAILRTIGNTVLLISLLGYLLAAMRRVHSYHALMSFGNNRSSDLMYALFMSWFLSSVDSLLGCSPLFLHSAVSCIARASFSVAIYLLFILLSILGFDPMSLWAGLSLLPVCCPGYPGFSAVGAPGGG
ncbi:hypothetical protein F511_37944 [Dorcoceras hygrometricum]|uniref:Uncharacterized protein n=1 Tax=Dorcoceras hygrometricum TaxID=472368 RepID=A0A2Z7CUL5_9LAMI|nr:hypothetical protein F511_37944 [Dorcoceras hygrometricum]